MEAELVYFIELRIDLIIKLILVDLLWVLGLKITENYTSFFLLFLCGFIICFVILFRNFNHLFFG